MDRNQAIEIIKRATVYTDEEREALELLVPELAESEDERIRKKLIQLVNKESGWQQEFPSQGQCLAWLEKQGEKAENATETLAKILKDSAEGFRRILKKKGIDYNVSDVFWEGEAKTYSKAEDNEFRRWMGDLMEHIPIEETHEYKKGFEAGQKQMKEDIEKGFGISEHSFEYLAGRYAGYEAGKAEMYKLMQKEQKPYASETMNEKGDFDGGFTGMMEGKTEDEEDKDAHTMMDLVQYITEWKNRAADRESIQTSPIDVEACKEMLDWIERHKGSCMDYIEEGEKRGIKDVIENPEKYGLKVAENPVLEDTVKEKIKSYIAGHFITDEVVKTDVNAIVHAMEEGVRIGVEEEKSNPFSTCNKCGEYQKGYEAGKTIGNTIGYNRAITEMRDVEDVADCMNTEFEKQLAHVIASVLKGEHEYTTETVKWFAQALLGYAKSEAKPETVYWSGEDEKMAKFYDDDYNNRIGDMPMKDVVEMRLKFKDWIINRIKHIRPPYKEQWRPTKEQMNALRYLLDEYGPWFLSSVDARRELRKMKNELEKEFGL